MFLRSQQSNGITDKFYELSFKRIFKNKVEHKEDFPENLKEEIKKSSEEPHPEDLKEEMREGAEELHPEEINEAVITLLSLSKPFIPKNTALVFDVETTGLVNSKMNLIDYPYITQISMIIFDIDEKKIIQSFNHYINIPQEILISEKITELTGITREICDKKGISIIDALTQFYKYYCSSQMIIAHNIEFDSQILMGEFYRNRENSNICKYAKFWKNIKIFDIENQLYKEKLSYTEKHPKIYCTMKQSKELCNLKCINKNNQTFIKYPKLIETYKELFPDDKIPENLHNSIIDTLICLRCFVKLKYNEDISQNYNSHYNTFYNNIDNSPLPFYPIQKTI